MSFQLNPAIETFALLTVPQWGKEQKRETIKELDDLGINGIAFYASHYSLLEKLFAAFARHKVRTEGCDLIEDMADEIALALVAILLLYPEWLEAFPSMPDDEVRAAIHGVIGELLEGDGDVSETLQASGLSDKAKWQATALLQQPKQRLQPVLDAINANLPAFDYAYSKVKSDVEPLLADLEERAADNTLPEVISQAVGANPHVRIVPSLTSGLGILMYEKTCIVGLFIVGVFAGQDEELSKTEAVLAAKALSDANRLEILRALKEDEMYNLEIARMLDLTPATTSHHMNALLSAGFVKGAVKDGKAYYRLCPEGIRRYRDWLESRFL